MRNKGAPWSEINKFYKLSPHYLIDHINLDDYPKFGNGTKPCTTCGQTKPLTEFYSDKRNGKIYRHNTCKVCVSQKRNKKINKDMLAELITTIYRSDVQLIMHDDINWNYVETILNKYKYTIGDK
jgi:hypothetical protein